MKKTLRKLNCLLVLGSLIMTSLAGCVSGADTALDVSEKIEGSKNIIVSTTEDATEDENDSTTEDNMDDTEEIQQENAESSIIGSGSALEKSQVAGNEGLYELVIPELPLGTRTIDMRAFGDNLLILTEKYDSDVSSYEDMLYLISPLDMKIIKKCKLSGRSYYNKNIFINDENNIAVVDLDNGNVHFFNEKLKEYGVAETGKTELNGCYVSPDFTKIYFNYKYGNDVFCYDVNEEKLTKLFTQDGSNKYEDYINVSIVGMWPDKELIMLSLYDEETGDSSYVVRNVNTGEVVDSDYVSVSFFQGQGDSYVARAYVDGVREIMYRNSESDGDKILALPTYDEYGNVHVDIESSLIITDVEEENGNINTVSVNAYNRNTGKKENASELKFDVSWGCVYLSNATVLDSLNIAVLDLQGGIFVWDLADASTQVQDEKSYAKPRKSLEKLLAEDYAELRETADDIGSRYSVEVYFGDDVNDCSRDVYEYSPAYNGVRIRQSLDILDYALSRYPEGMFAELAQGDGGILKIYLSGQILATDVNAVTDVAGVQNTEADDAYIVLNIYRTVDFENAIYHEICHALEKYMESEGYYYEYYGYKPWQACNPEDFDYDYDYMANADSSDWTYVVGNSQNDVYFLDIYSKSFPDEDRASIMEYAMMDEENQSGYFKNEYLANKLSCISTMLRKCFDDSNWPEATSWEKALE